MTIISVHFPKTAGSSLKAAWTQAFGKERVLELYTDNPADTRSAIHLDPEYFVRRPVEVPAGIDVVHGHFSPRRYSHLEDVTFVTFLRHPIDNLLSIYAFWKTFPRCGDPLHEYFLNYNLTVVETARLPVLRHLMSRTYFGNFDMGRFAFIGDASTYRQDLERLSTIVGRQLQHLRENVTIERERASGSESLYANLKADTSLRQTLTDILAEDIAFYEKFGEPA
jgi:hypothetical protein